ncbi:hypothetical protein PAPPERLAPAPP_02590 [Brevundimonas phage vB_BpoS-Papperlapapp]|uniref:Uncharacterized protein n=2 Tax=Marchewkavirus TaxID=3425052 RepID=A0A9E7SLM4_9CAUD|nr:hypothetical protein KABACHOK_00960 [Brevundimonas phage vB_BpoS-Kabachok]USN14629.1 hypothetical protein DOMOVOI_01550 [Brevundimonas phage vB_BpoS-Domovoi]USN16000.1 hypothetical protein PAPPERLAPAPP_02590 [Brevundimonas phage vB_BpoS-Papperlapapp]
MTTVETEMRRLGVTADQVGRAQALFDQTAPRGGVKAAVRPFHLWLDQTQRYFLSAANA